MLTQIEECQPPEVIELNNPPVDTAQRVTAGAYGAVVTLNGCVIATLSMFETLVIWTRGLKYDLGTVVEWRVER